MMVVPVAESHGILYPLICRLPFTLEILLFIGAIGEGGQSYGWTTKTERSFAGR
jgi:hypothetical protein